MLIIISLSINICRLLVSRESLGSHLCCSYGCSVVLGHLDSRAGRHRCLGGGHRLGVVGDIIRSDDHGLGRLDRKLPVLGGGGAAGRRVVAETPTDPVIIDWLAAARYCRLVCLHGEVR